MHVVVRKFIDIINPRTLFTSDAELAHAAGLIAQFRDLGGAPPGVSNEQMWAARSTLEAIVHPDTGKPIPLLFRSACRHRPTAIPCRWLNIVCPSGSRRSSP